MNFHPRNRHQGRYDFQKLIESCPDLARFVTRNRDGEPTVDFADRAAVKALNRALLKSFYGLENWDIPENYLCPPIPGRADAIHCVADLLASTHAGVIPRGKSIRVLDVGVGANCVYPIIGHAEYGWHFVGTDVDPKALASARKILDSNGLGDAIELRKQASASHIFQGVLKDQERFDASICNPPFHASLEEAQRGSRRKWKSLGHGEKARKTPHLNFGGHGTELWCPGGELGFVRRMIEESVRVRTQCRWFTTLVSKESNLLRIEQALKVAKVSESRVIDMAQGQKKSRIVAWTFL